MSLQPFYQSPNIIEVGVDESGRGPLLGRVYAGAVIWDPEVTSPLIRDSKKLNERKRLIAYDFIKENCLSCGIGYSEVEEIDRINILNATLKAMHKAIDNTYLCPEYILCDGTNFKIYMDRHDNAVPHTCIIKGDDTYYSIAAAGIIAKVERDAYVKQLCEDHPELNVYQLTKNKGYGTSDHIKAMQNWGISPFHRKSFQICQRLDKQS